jgi:hypothetical protein
MLNLIMALNNRCMLSLLSKRTERLVADFRRTQVIARETGFPVVECSAAKDLGEVHFLLGQLEAAERQAQQAIAVCLQVMGERARATLSAQLLLARVRLRRGDRDGAREVATRIRAVQAAARGAGQTDVELPPSEDLLAGMIDLSLAEEPLPAGAWDELWERARGMTLQPQDLVELMEMRGLAALGAGRPGEAARLLDEAAAEADRSAEIVGDRVRRARALIAGSGGDIERPAAEG